MEVYPLLNLTYKHSINNVKHPCQHIFDFYSPNGDCNVGRLVCHKSGIKLRPNYDGDVLAIDFINVTNKKQGFGTKILNFAEEFSKSIGCNGYMTLKADSSYTPKEIPHLFYFNYGFSTLDEKTDKKLSKFVKKRKYATSKDFPCLIMHYPSVSPIKTSFAENVFKCIKEILIKISKK